jgi:hypothetical protein
LSTSGGVRLLDPYLARRHHLRQVLRLFLEFQEDLLQLARSFFYKLSVDIWNSMTKEKFVELFLSCEALKSLQINFDRTLFVESFHFAEAITACGRLKGASMKRVKEQFRQLCSEREN